MLLFSLPGGGGRKPLGKTHRNRLLHLFQTSAARNRGFRVQLATQLTTRSPSTLPTAHALHAVLDHPDRHRRKLFDLLARRLTHWVALIPSEIGDADRNLVDAEDRLRDAVREASAAGMSFRDLEARTSYTRSSLSRSVGNKG